MDLERVAQPGAGEDHRAHDQMVGERRVDAAERLDHLADRGDVGVEVAIELGVAELGEGLHLEALVAVVHVDRQQAADVGVVDRHRAGRAGAEVGWLAVLADQVDLVAERASARARLAL